MVSHRIWSGALPYSTAVGDEAEGTGGITVANRFYVTGHDNWTLDGAGVWASGAAVTNIFTIKAWAGHVLPADFLGTPDRQAVVSSAVAGWNEVTWEPLAISDISDGGQRFTIGYHCFDYVYATNGPTSDVFVQADDASPLFYSEADPSGSGNRGGFHYQSGANAASAATWCINPLVSEAVLPQLDILEDGSWVRANVLGVGESGNIVNVNVL